MSIPLSFERDIKGLFYKYAQDMQSIALATNTDQDKDQNNDGGDIRHLILNDYQSVKAFHLRIQKSLHGYDYDSNSGRWLVPEPQRLPVPGGSGDDRWLKSAPHPMPPDGPLPQQGIDLFDQWVRDGMLP